MPAGASGSTCCAVTLRLRRLTIASCATICRRGLWCTPASTAAKTLASESQLANLVSLMRSESAADHLGGRAMLNALSTSMFALVLRLASETSDAPVGLLAVAGHPRLAPALRALFNEPARAWSLPELARLCNMSRATLA